MLFYSQILEIIYFNHRANRTQSIYSRLHEMILLWTYLKLKLTNISMTRICSRNAFRSSGSSELVKVLGHASAKTDDVLCGDSFASKVTVTLATSAPCAI